MALFDFKNMGVDLLNERSARKAEKKRAAKEGAAAEEPVAPLFMEDDDEEEGANEISILFSEACLNDVEADATSVASGAALDLFTDEEGTDDDQDGVGAEAADARSVSSANSKSSLVRRGRRALSSLSMTFRSRATSEERSSAKKAKKAAAKAAAKPTTQDSNALAVYEPISVETSNALSIQAYDRGFGPAFALLKTMNRADREAIMKMLFIKRKTEACNDELDAYAILFKSIYGIRARTNTALRQMRVLKQATWVHSILKVATALELNARMVISSGDWRLPTRITEGVSHKQALLASTEEFMHGSSEVLDRAEKKFFVKLQRNIEARLGKVVARAIKAWVVEKAGPEHAAKFAKPSAATEEEPPIAAEGEPLGADDQGASFVPLLDPRAERAESSRSDSDLELEGELAGLEAAFNIPHLIANIEKAKPGFGHFVVLLVEIFALKAKEQGAFQFCNQKALIKKLGVVALKDASIGLTVGITLSTFVNPLLGLPMCFLSLTNLALGTTEFNIIEPVYLIMLHMLVLASNGTSVLDLI